MSEENMGLGVVHRVTNQSGEFHGWMIFCPGCKSCHVFDSRWTFNNDMIKPTFRVSMLVNQSNPEKRCHSFVTDGKIEFLSDCFHELKNKTVNLEEF